MDYVRFILGNALDVVPHRLGQAIDESRVIVDEGFCTRVLALGAKDDRVSTDSEMARLLESF
jgi:hypothetical protein